MESKLKKIEVLFEFATQRKKHTEYRAVKCIDGSFRMEKRGHGAKTYRAIMWTGSLEGLLRFQEAVLGFKG